MSNYGVHTIGRYTAYIDSLVILTVGGTGAIGSLLAVWLAERSSSPIFLLGRSGRHPADSHLNYYR